MRSAVTNKFNRGELSPLALGRDDVEKINNSCELMQNFEPLRLGPMMYRRGTIDMGALTADTYSIPFVAGKTDVADIEFTTTDVRVWVDNALVTRPNSSMTISNENFTTNLDDWNDTSESGSSVIWSADGARFTGNEATRAKLWQQLDGTISDTALRIVIKHTPMLVKIGSNGEDSDDIFSGYLGPGEHSFLIEASSMSARPTLTFSNSFDRYSTLAECSVESSGNMSLPLPNTITTLSSIRYTQSADVIFCATSNTPQFKVERRGTNSWSVVEYRSDKGPFGTINTTDINLRVDDLFGDTTLRSSQPLFQPGCEGDLYKVTSSGQIREKTVTAENDGTKSIKVTGLAGKPFSSDFPDITKGSSRKFKITVARNDGGTGLGGATVNLQRSADNLVWTNVANQAYTGKQNAKVFDDEFSNSIFYYRLFVETGNFGTQDLDLKLDYDSGGIDGICRITKYRTAVTASVQITDPFGSTDDSNDWFKGEWSADNGYPTAGSLYEGRLFWAGKTKIWGSESDRFESFNSALTGDNKPIRRTVGFGPVDDVSWLSHSARLMMGLASDEISIRSNSFGETLTNTNTNLKSGSTQGAAPLDAMRVDDTIMYVQRAGKRVMSSVYGAQNDTNSSTDLMTLHPSICSAGIKRIFISRQPETRLYVLLDNGELRVHLKEPVEGVAAWSRIVVDGDIKDLMVIPASTDDIVYITVERGGSLRKERFSAFDNATTEYFDSSVVFTNHGSLTLTGLDHLDDETVGVNADGVDLGDFIVSSGSITLEATYTKVVVGSRFTAKWKSSKVSRYIEQSVLGKIKRVVDLGMVLYQYQPGSIKHGPDFDTLEDMPSYEGETGLDITGTTIVDDYDEYPIEFNGESEVDPRICLQATGPCTILALEYGVEHDGDPANQG